MQRLALILVAAAFTFGSATAVQAQPGTGTLGFTYEYKVYSAEDVEGLVEWEVEVLGSDGNWNFVQTYTDYDGLVRFLLRTLDEVRVTAYPRTPDWVYEATFDNYDAAAILAEAIEMTTGRVTRIEQVLSTEPTDLTVVSHYNLIEIPRKSILDPIPNPAGPLLRKQTESVSRNYR